VADYQDLLDAITRIRQATGDDGAWMAGLSAGDIAAAANPVSAPAVISAVLAKLRAAHTDVFPPGSVSGLWPQAPGQSEGAAAEAIRTAETALAQQNSQTAQLDLQVVTAVLNAHTNHAEGVAALDRLQSEIEAAVVTRTDLDTPAGARSFQRYLIDKLRDIRSVVETADMDSTSKASLAAALASLYASSASGDIASPTDRGRQPSELPPAAPAPTPAVSGRTEPRIPAPLDPATPVDLGLDPVSPLGDAVGNPPADYPPPPTAMPAPAVSPIGWGGGAPGAGMPFSGGLPTLSASSLPGFSTDPVVDPPRHDAKDTPAATNDSPDQPLPDDPNGADLPGSDMPGPIGTAPSPQLAAVIAAAVAGTPIQEAFSAQGITIPAPGSVIATPLDPTQVVAGDIGVLTDRHALALGGGKALLDQQIQPLGAVSGPGFVGWQHPPEPVRTTAPEVPAPIPPGPTATG
jgi:hypothetical protein